MSKEDPKHGRWILPLVVLALVAFTFTFVNNLPPAETPVDTTSVAGGDTTTTAPPEDTTTTTLTPEVVTFVATVDSLSSRAAALSTQAQTINEEYPDTTGYGATNELLSELKETTAVFVEDVLAVNVLGLPEGAIEKWDDVTTAANAMQRGADDMLDGLVNTSGSEARLAALEEYNTAAATCIQDLEAAKAAATSP